jgi:toxin-antitoxin system PIN domain toxin
MSHLLDVNVLLAAIWTTHPQHEKSQAWLKGRQVTLCPISELGFIRISSGRAFQIPMSSVRQGLEEFVRQRSARRIPDDLPAMDSRPARTAQVMDFYLADLAAKHGLKLATFDQDIRHPSAELIPS